MKKGLTALEIILVTAIIGLLVFFILGYYRPTIKRAREVLLKAELRSIEAAVNLYQVKYSRFPSSLVNLEYLELEKKGNLLDPFGRRYCYNPSTGRVWSGE